MKDSWQRTVIKVCQSRMGEDMKEYYLEVLKIFIEGKK